MALRSAGPAAEELAASLSCTAILAKFSRLYIDVNRPLSSNTLIRPTADDIPIELNAGGRDFR